MDKILVLNPKAHGYLNALSVDTWALHPNINTLSLYSHKTRNLIEGLNSK